MPFEKAVREQVIELLNRGNAHATFHQVIDGFPVDKAGERPAGSPHSAWELLEHMRIAQKDILLFSRSADYVSPEWPKDYWPKSAAPNGPDEWKRSVADFQADLAEFTSLLRDEKNDLHRKFPWGDGQTLLREALVLADHNSYHLGQLVMVRRLLGNWA